MQIQPLLPKNGHSYTNTMISNLEYHVKAKNASIFLPKQLFFCPLTRLAVRRKIGSAAVCGRGIIQSLSHFPSLPAETPSVRLGMPLPVLHALENFSLYYCPKPHRFFAFSMIFTNRHCNLSGYMIPYIKIIRLICKNSLLKGFCL